MGVARKPTTALQVLAALGRIERRVKSGETVAQACARAGVGVATYRRWKKDYGGLARKMEKAAPPAAAAGTPDRQHLDLAMQALDQGIYEWDIAGNSIYFSESVYRALGTTPQKDDTPHTWRVRIHPDDLPAYDAAYRAHFKGETERFECDYRFHADDGTWHWARQHGIAIRDARGRAVRMVGSTGDISELKQSELDLKRSRDETAEALNRQTATADILRVISRSTTDVRPVFDSIAESAIRLLRGWSAAIWQAEGGQLRVCKTNPDTYHQGLNALCVYALLQAGQAIKESCLVMPSMKHLN